MKKKQQKARNPWPLLIYLEEDDVPKSRNNWYCTIAIEEKRKKRKNPHVDCRFVIVVEKNSGKNTIFGMHKLSTHKLKFGISTC